MGLRLALQALQERCKVNWQRAQSPADSVAFAPPLYRGGQKSNAPGWGKMNF